MSRLIIIGGGPGGYTAALQAVQEGLEVVLVEETRLGGTCLQRGCIPSKTIRTSAQALEITNRLYDFGLNGNPAKVNWDKLLDRKSQVVDILSNSLEELFRNRNITVLNDRAVISAPKEVTLLNSGQVLRADNIILATGAGPRHELTPFIKHNCNEIIDSNDLLNLPQLPSSVCIVGGGAVGCEWAFILSMLGVKITLVEYMSRLLPFPSLDEQISLLLAREFQRRNIGLVLDAKAESYQPGVGGGIDIALSNGQVVSADKLLISAGREPMTNGLGLEGMGVKNLAGAVQVDNCLNTGIPWLWAVGDVLGSQGRPMLAHTASYEAKVAVANIMGIKSEVDYNLVPSVVFTVPEVAWVGANHHQRPETTLHTWPVRHIGLAQALGEISGQINLVSHNDKLVGAHIMAPHAAELIHECVLAIKYGIDLAELADTIHAHPTMSEGLVEAIIN